MDFTDTLTRIDRIEQIDTTLSDENDSSHPVHPDEAEQNVPPEEPSGSPSTQRRTLSPQRLRKIWSRPVFWLVGIIASAIGIAVTNAIVPRLSEMFDRIPESGQPVLVSDVHTYWTPWVSGLSVVFPADVPFTDSMLSEVNSIDGFEKKADWLREHGGAAVGDIYISIAVTGNRKDGVRILDIRPITKCLAPDTGALFFLPPQGGAHSIGLHFDLDQSYSKAEYRDESGQVSAYFPERTITLTKNEQQILQITATTRAHACSFALELTVLDGSKRKKQIITESSGRQFEVSGFSDQSSYREVYLDYCGSGNELVRAVSGWKCP